MESGLDQNMFSAGHSKQKQKWIKIEPHPIFFHKPDPISSAQNEIHVKNFAGNWKEIPDFIEILEKARKKTSENWPKHLHLKAEVARKKSKWTLALLSHSKPKQGKSKGVYTKKPNVIHKLINFRNSSDLLDLIELFFQLSKWRTTEKQLNPIHFFN